MITTPGSHSTRGGAALRARTALLGTLTLLVGCIDDIGSSSSAGGGITGDIVPLEAMPRVDLPGRVSVFFQVLGPSGTGVANLQGAEFELLEDGVPVSPTESKQRLLSKPRVFRSYSLLLLDRSGSIADSPTGELEQIEAATAYIELVTQSPASYIALAWFDGSFDIRPVLLDDFSELGFSNDTEKLLEAVANLHDQPPTSTSTNLNGAVLRGLEELDAIDLEAVARGIDFRSLTLVTFTDGTDQAGTTPIEDVLERLAELEAGGRHRFRAFTIGLGSEINSAALRELGPDGTVFAQGFGDLTPQFQFIAQAVADVANSFYFLSYCSPKQDGSGQHSLRVRVRRSDLVAEELYQFSADYFSGGCGFVDFFEPVEQRGEIFVGSMQVDTDGRVLIVGAQKSKGVVASQLTLVRVLDDGTPDPAFGVEGRVVLSQTGSFPSLRGMAVDVDSDGTIVVGGIVGVGDLDASLTRAALWRFAENGALLESLVLPSLSSDGDALNDMAIDSERRIVAVGRAGRATSQTAVWRYLPSLLPDTGFAAPDGFFLHEAIAGAAGDEARALALAPDDSLAIVASARSVVFNDPDLEVLRVAATGQLDTSFGGSGSVRGHAVQSLVAGNGLAVAIDSLGRVIVGGSFTETGRPERPALWRFRPDGSPDLTFIGSPFARFFSTGMVVLPDELVESARIFFGDRARVHDLAIHSDDSIVAYGMRMNAALHTDVASWRFAVDGQLERAYNGTGFLIDDGALGNGTHEEARAMLIHTDGRVFAAGIARQNGAETGDSRLGLWIDSEIERVFAPTGNN